MPTNLTKYPFDEMTRVYVCNSIASMTAPTLVELNAGRDITCYLTADGLKLGAGNNSIPTGGLCSDIDSQVPGRRTFNASLTGFRFEDDVPDGLWDLAKKGDRRFLVVRYGQPYDQAWASGDRVIVYDFKYGKRAMADTGNDALATFSVPLHIAAEEDDAYVAGAS